MRHSVRAKIYSSSKDGNFSPTRVESWCSQWVYCHTTKWMCLWEEGK